MTGGVILVTGGAGFIGSNIVAELLSTGDREVVVCDRLRGAETGKWRNLSKHPIHDLIRPDNLWAWLATHGDRIELIVHMGAISSTQEADADKILETNFGLSRDLYRWSVNHACRFIYASSAATYGDGSQGFDDAPTVAALAALRPLNAYGWSKALFDLFVARETLAGRSPPQCVGLKFFNVYGPNEGHKGSMASLVAQMWPRVAVGAGVVLFRSHRPDFADGGQLRDFVHVQDVARIVAWLADNSEVSGLFNVGSGVARSFAELAGAVFAAADLAPNISYVDMPVGMRANYQYFTQARMHRLRGAGYAATPTGLEAGVADYVRGFLAAADPYL